MLINNYVTQEFSMEEDVSIKYVGLKLVIANDPVGTFTIKILEDSREIASKSFTMSDVKACGNLNDNEYHKGMFTFDFQNYFNLYHDVTYKIELSSSGYTYSHDSYLIWIRDHEKPLNFISYSTEDYNKSLTYKLLGV